MLRMLRMPEVLRRAIVIFYCVNYYVLPVTYLLLSNYFTALPELALGWATQEGHTDVLL